MATATTVGVVNIQNPLQGVEYVFQQVSLALELSITGPDLFLPCHWQSNHLSQHWWVPKCSEIWKLLLMATELTQCVYENHEVLWKVILRLVSLLQYNGGIVLQVRRASRRMVFDPGTLNQIWGHKKGRRFPVLVDLLHRWSIYSNLHQNMVMKEVTCLYKLNF